MYYVFIENGKINGAGQVRLLNDEIINFEIDELTYNAYIANPDKYIWSGTDIEINPNYEEEQAQKERKRINLLSLTKREVFLAVYKDKGITPEQIRATITDTAALIEFDYANEYYRGNPLIGLLGAQLGYTSEELDYLFENKELPPKEEQDEETPAIEEDQTGEPLETESEDV